MMNRKGRQNASQSPSKEKVAKAAHESPRAKSKVEEKSGKGNKAGTSKGKGKVKSVGGISRPKITPIIKKRKVPEPSESDEDSDFNVEENVSDIQPRKKPSLGKLPKVPEV